MIPKSSTQPWLILICLALIACSEKKSDSLREEINARQTKREEMLDHLRGRFPGINEFESSDDPFTIVLQDKMRHNPLFLFTGFELFDVSRRDSMWVVELKNRFWTNHILELTCDSLMAQHAMNASKPEDEVTISRRELMRGPSAVVARLKSVNRIKLYITSKGEQEGDEVHSRIELDTDLPLRITGELIDVQ